MDKELIEKVKRLNEAGNRLADQQSSTKHNLNESVDKIRLSTKVKRGTGTRDQDEIQIKVRGDDPVEAVKNLNEALVALEETADLARNLQPQKEDEENE